MKKIAVVVVLMCVSCNFFDSKKNVDNTKKLIGTWYANDYRNSKWIYKTDGKLYNYYDDELLEVFNYSISNTCGNKVNDTIEYIKLIDKDSIEHCFKINAINKKKDGVLSIKNMDTGDTVLFVNNLNVKIN
ncbi:hypothetical protein [Flavobacterium undicola]|uniref:hypothetical protein n=1 Tax=Flavobacterium undicola TaxID=1932779 RepID=UPI0013773519|nr:hypothetical protein [Flavobacterium undicola]MBA0885284.1 hypothetical protein [Flavobacterium undicola]